ncbi:hypothetical protein SRABI91_02483 [Rhodococcoides fascians]|nr:hypothetical protein SRABI91_02483 [Rhodococcus fascians]
MGDATDRSQKSAELLFPAHSMAVRARDDKHAVCHHACTTSGSALAMCGPGRESVGLLEVTRAGLYFARASAMVTTRVAMWVSAAVVASSSSFLFSGPVTWLTP